MKRDSKERYGTISKLFHWGMAILLGWQMLRFFDRIEDGEHWVGQTLVPWHTEVGSLLLLFVVARLVWVAKQEARPVQDPATAILVRTGHGLLYACMVLLPVTGVLGRIGGGRGWSPFEVTIIPPGPEVAWAEALSSLHSPISWAFLALLVGHVTITLWHHFVRKDDRLRRMV
jgi:cytochrome b561